jgi:pimeloyl-ACP methyl ester carboxylesterase
MRLPYQKLTVALIWLIASQTAWSVTAAQIERSRNSDPDESARDYRNYSLYLNSNARYIDIRSGSAKEIRKATRRSNADSVDMHIERTQAQAIRVYEQMMQDHEANRCGAAGASPLRVLVFIHGGLNTIRQGLARIAYRTEAMLKDCYHPVFINWRSGLVSSYGESLKKWSPESSWSGSYWNAFLKLPADTVTMLAEAPQNWGEEAAHSFSSGRRTVAQMGLNDSELVGSTYEGMVRLPENTKQRGVSFRALRWWFTAPLKALSTPVVAKLGARSWDEMRNRALSLTHTPAHATDGVPTPGFGSVPAVCDRLESSGADCRPRGFTTIFFKALYDRLRASDQSFTMSLVGHSMGSIVVNDLLKALPETQLENLVHMASADTVERVRTIQTTYLQRHKTAKAYNLYLHPDNESRETRALGLAPSGSLLVWIDNMFSNPAVVSERTAGRWDNSARSLFQYPKSVATRVHHRVFTAKPANPDTVSEDPVACSPVDHGGFSSCPFWRKEFWFR